MSESKITVATLCIPESGPSDVVTGFLLVGCVIGHLGERLVDFGTEAGPNSTRLIHLGIEADPAEAGRLIDEALGKFRETTGIEGVHEKAAVKGYDKMMEHLAAVTAGRSAPVDRSKMN